MMNIIIMDLVMLLVIEVMKIGVCVMVDSGCVGVRLDCDCVMVIGLV